MRKLDLIRHYLDIVETGKQNPDNHDWQKLATRVQGYLDSAVLPDAAFSSMVQDFLRGGS